jgi:hypothetical protein
MLFYSGWRQAFTLAYYRQKSGEYLDIPYQNSIIIVHAIRCLRSIQQLTGNLEKVQKRTSLKIRMYLSGREGLNVHAIY